MNTAVATRQATSQKDTMAIVPGDRISTIKVDQYNYDELYAAVKKRYRSAHMVARQDVNDVLDLNLPLIKEAVEEVVKRTVARVGHDRDVILTTQELGDRALRSEAEGIVGALMAMLKKPSTEVEINRAIRQQVSMRKIDRDGDRVAHALMRALTDDKHVSLTYGNPRVPSTWMLRGGNAPFTKELYLDFYKHALRID